MVETTLERIAIVGAGPSGLFMLKNLLQFGKSGREISIFEKKEKIGQGMPYSIEGANIEHITNVSANEIPELVTSVNEWLESVPQEILDSYGIDANHFNEYKVLPRLLFGSYLEAQFHLLLMAAERSGVKVNIYLKSKINDIEDFPEKSTSVIYLEDGEKLEFDNVIICTGHFWPKKLEGKIPGYFDSPYPPAKLQFKANHTVALKGSSLTAIDAIRTLSRHNGEFSKDKNGQLHYQRNAESSKFKMIMHSRSGLLPSIRFHLEDSHLGTKSMLTKKEIDEHIKENGGFLSLDFLFDQNFKKILVERDPETYGTIAHMKLEEFTDLMMTYREHKPPFTLFQEEYDTAGKSIELKKSIYWKELLAILSFSLNYPAKYLAAEDMIRLQKSLMPLISLIIAFVPQSSASEILALHRAGALDIVSVGDESEVLENENGGITYNYVDENGVHSEQFESFVDCVGQPHLSYDSFPFRGLCSGTVSAASLVFRSEKEARKAIKKGNEKVFEQDNQYFLSVPGITINDDFQIVGEKGQVNKRIFIMAVPYIGGYNPDYSGLDFCEEASRRISIAILK